MGRETALSQEGEHADMNIGQLTTGLIFLMTAVALGNAAVVQTTGAYMAALLWLSMALVAYVIEQGVNLWRA